MCMLTVLLAITVRIRQLGHTCLRAKLTARMEGNALRTSNALLLTTAGIKVKQTNKLKQSVAWRCTLATKVQLSDGLDHLLNWLITPRMVNSAKVDWRSMSVKMKQNAQRLTRLSLMELRLMLHTAAQLLILTSAARFSSKKAMPIRESLMCFVVVLCQIQRRDSARVLLAPILMLKL